MFNCKIIRLEIKQRRIIPDDLPLSACQHNCLIYCNDRFDTVLFFLHICLDLLLYLFKRDIADIMLNAAGIFTGCLWIYAN